MVDMETTMRTSTKLLLLIIVVMSLAVLLLPKLEEFIESRHISIRSTERSNNQQNPREGISFAVRERQGW